MPNEPQQPKKPAGGPPPAPPSHDARSKKHAAQSAPPVVTAPPVVAPPIQSTAPRAKITLSQFYKNPPPGDESSSEAIDVEIESSAPTDEMAANPLLASIAASKSSFDEDSEDEFKLMPVDAISAERIYTQTVLADAEVAVNKRMIAEEKERVRSKSRTEASEGMLQFSTMQMFAGVMIGAFGIFLTRFVMSNIIAQGVSFVFLMGSVICFAMLQKTHDDRVWLVAQTFCLLYIASLLIGVAIQ